MDCILHRLAAEYLRQPIASGFKCCCPATPQAPQPLADLCHPEWSRGPRLAHHHLPSTAAITFARFRCLYTGPIRRRYTAMDLPPIVSPQEWDTARRELLVKEKELTRARDALAAQRRRMPRMAVEKDYLFDGPRGPAGLLDLFDGRRQLVVYRFFFQPDVDGWPDAGCPGCSMLADQVAHLAHLNARDTTLVFVSGAPQEAIARLKKRMGWDIPWYTLTDSFDADFGVDEWHGTNAFLRDGQSIFRTYFIDNRGDEAMGSTWAYLDITALGRQEEWEASPDGYPQTPPYRWWN